MPTFETDKAAILWNATAVPNAFLCEFMPAAPEGHVKVYLYSLMYAHAGTNSDEAMLDDIAKALHMDRPEVERALRYWERCRLVTRVKNDPPTYRFLSVPQALSQRQLAPVDEAYEGFAQAIYAAFGDRRKLHGGETVLAYEWVEQLKLPPEVVLMLIQHMIATRGVQFSFKEAQKVATDLSEQGVNTLEAAEIQFSRSEAAWKGARKVLTRLGKRRSPSMDEIDLYVKWTTEWGFAPKAIESACAETTKGDPSFAYLDAILSGIFERSGGRAITADKMEKHLSEERDETANVREVLVAFGQKAPVIDRGKRMVYRAMRELAEHEVIMLAANEVGKRRGHHSLDELPALLSAWKEKGLDSVEKVQAHLQLVAAQNARLRELYALAGRDGGGASQQNRESLRRWRDDWKLPDALLDLAATYANGVERPMPYMEKLLSSWRDAGALTVEAAKAEHDRITAERGRGGAGAGGAGGGVSGAKKQTIEQRYEQRTYDPADVDAIPEELLEAAKRK